LDLTLPQLPAELDHVLSLLACPACRSALHRSSASEGDGKIVCEKCGREYPVVDGIPVLIADAE
jgi:uncharacterized protein YbaR (Trm112 family)